MNFSHISESLKWWGLFALLITKGFGNIFLMKLGVALPLAFLSAYTLLNKKYKQSTTTLSLIILAYLEWPLINLWGFWALASFACLGRDHRYSFGLSSGFLALWLFQENELGSWSALPYIALPLFFALISLGSRFNKLLLYPLLAGCIAYTGIEIANMVTNRPTVQVAQGLHIAKGYGPGPLLAKILHAEVVAPGCFSGDVGISSLTFDKGPFASSRRHILLAEHDLDFSDKNIIPENAQQMEPWVFNQMFGNQYLLEAVARDGAWMGNLGGSLHPGGQLLLGSYSHLGKQSFAPLAIRHSTFVYVQDSDSFVDRVASRQVNTVSEISLGRITPRLLNMLFCLLIILPSNLFGLFCRVLAPLVILIALKMPAPGDVRIYAHIDWPHEPSKASGVLASLTDAGFYFLKGDKDTRILIVGEGRSIKALPTEKLVILEPEATVYINDYKIKAGKEPHGQLDDIIDSRMLYVDDIATGVQVIIDGHRVIGSGSPAKTEWQKWLSSVD